MRNRYWLTLLLLGSAEVAVAQTTSSQPPTVGVTPREIVGAIVQQLEVRAAVNASYESNVFGINESVIRTRAGNRSLDDFQISPSLQLNFTLPFGRQSAFLRGQVGYDFHLKNEQLNRERISLDGGANLALGGCTGAVTGTFSRFRSNAGDIFAIDPILVDDVLRVRNNVLTRYSAGGQVRCGGAIGLSPSIGYRHTKTRNSSPLLELNDSNVDTVDGSLGYQRPSLGRVSVYGTYSKGEFLGRDIFFRRRGVDPDFNPGALDGVESYSAGVRLERDIGTRAYGTVSIGYSWANPNSPFSQKFRGSSYEVNLSLRPSERLGVDLLAARSADLASNVSVFSSFAVTEVYSVNMSYRLNQRINLSAGSSWQKRDFRLTSVQDVPGSPLNVVPLNGDEFIRAYGAVNFDLNRRLRLNALVSQQRRKSNNARFGFNNTTVSVGASLALGR